MVASASSSETPQCPSGVLQPGQSAACGADGGLDPGCIDRVPIVEFRAVLHQHSAAPPMSGRPKGLNQKAHAGQARIRISRAAAGPGPDRTFDGRGQAGRGPVARQRQICDAGLRAVPSARLRSCAASGGEGGPAFSSNHPGRPASVLPERPRASADFTSGQIGGGDVLRVARSTWRLAALTGDRDMTPALTNTHSAVRAHQTDEPGGRARGHVRREPRSRKWMLRIDS